MTNFTNAPQESLQTSAQESLQNTSQNADNTLNVAGWSKMSTVDWPGEIVTTLFLQGCPWRCNYCHNSDILDPNVKGDVSLESDVLPHLEKRVGLLDGVVFSGGEPLMQATNEDGGELLRAIKKVLELKNRDGKAAYRIGLHTGGSLPHAFKKVLPYLDWVGFDIKAPTGLYDAITNLQGSEIAARKSLGLLLEEREFRKNSDHPLGVQFRTTVDPTVMSEADVLRLKSELHQKCIDNLVIQEVRPQGAPEGYAQKLAKALQKR